MDEIVKKPPPPPLPATTQAWMDKRINKTKRTLNDMVEELHLILTQNDDYNKFLVAVWDEQAVEGSLAADNYEAAAMIRNLAKEMKTPVAFEKKATISKSLGVVLRRYGEARKERRHTLHGEVIPHKDGGDNNGDGA